MTKPDDGTRIDERAGAALLRVVAWLAPAHRRDEFVGDLIEEAGAILERRGRWRAFLWLCAQVIGSLPAMVVWRAVWRFRARRTSVKAVPVRTPGGIALSTAEVGNAFQAFLGNGAGRARRPGGLLLSAAIHGGLIMFGVGWTMMQVDEVEAPKLPPLIISRSLFQPPKPDAPVGVRATVVTERKPMRRPPIVPPTPRPPVAIAPPRPVPEVVGPIGAITDPSMQATDDDSGRPAGIRGTCPPGAACDPQATGVGTFVPPSVAEKRCLSCPSPRLPPAFARMAPRQVIETKVCVDIEGRVSSCDVTRGIDPSADVQVCATVRAWRLAPLTVNGHPVPFCYDMRFVFVND